MSCSSVRALPPPTCARMPLLATPGWRRARLWPWAGCWNTDPALRLASLVNYSLVPSTAAAGGEGATCPPPPCTQPRGLHTQKQRLFSSLYHSCGRTHRRTLSEPTAAGEPAHCGMRDAVSEWSGWVGGCGTSSVGQYKGKGGGGARWVTWVKTALSSWRTLAHAAQCCEASFSGR